MYFYLDGYNLLFSLSDSKNSLAKQREQLIEFLQQQFALRNMQGLLVFDGTYHRNEESGRSYRTPLEIAYAPKGQTADSYIIELIEFAKNPRQITVVTNDQALKTHARCLGAKVQDNQKFLHMIAKKRKKKQIKEPVETEKNMQRLLKIFEEKLEKGEDFF